MSDTSIDITILEPCWSEALKNIDRLCDQAISAARAAADIEQEAELSIALMNDAAIQALNRDYRSKDVPTNVLSFPAKHPDMFGDIALSLETLEREAQGRGITLDAHFTHLVIHGFLHLCGYDHIKDDEAQIMESLEIKALAALDLPSPYA